MKIQSVIPLGLIVLVALSLCEANDCPYGKYWDSDYNTCRLCSRCPAGVISRDSQWQFIVPMGQCEIYKSLCPDWCSVETRDTGTDDERAKALCPPTMPSPPVPFVNVTITGPTYNETASSYTASCTMYFKDMDTPTLQWTNPTGQPLMSSDTSGKWKVNQEVVTEGVILNLVISGFEKEDEGEYLCTAGERIANQSVLLKYVEPPPTTSPPTTPHEGTTKPPGTKPPVGPSTTQNGEGLSETMMIAIGTLATIILIVVIVICAALAYWCIRHRSPSIPRSRVADFESHPLTGSNFVDGLALRTEDFMSAKVLGLQACLEQPNCRAVIIKQNTRRIGQVKSGHDTFFIENVAWNDSIEVCMKYHRRKAQCIKILKMNCLKIGNITETSAIITCPSVENTFFLRYEEKNASHGSSSQAGQEVVMHGGRKEIHNLRPGIAYCVHLGIRGQTGDTGAYNWVWKDEFSTKCISFQPVAASETSVKLVLTEQSVLRSVSVYCAINGSKPKQMKSAETQFSALVPGMDQFLCIQEKIGHTESYRILKEIPFKTTGSVQNGGDYSEYATTDCPSDRDRDVVLSTPQKKLPNRKLPLKCKTGLWEALHDLRDDPITYSRVYSRAEQSIVKAVLDSLVDFLKVYKDFVPQVLPDVSSSRRMKGMDLIEEFIRQLNMVNYTGIFDILRRFIEKEEVRTQAGVSFAEQLLNAHSKEYGTCHVCKHAVYLLKKYEQRDPSQTVVC